MLEKNLQKNILAICKKESILARKVDSTSARGWPDITAVLPNGQVLFIELKTATGKLSKLQEYTLQKLQENNANSYVIRSVKEFRQIVKAHS